ncbi:hypothetical protein F4859DRAFT_219111 [Xylaria cf. heliscus]|nr:hypothetical protein F4859DRAFT_219111 [Xylaria cf. heliscus]
MDFFKNLLTNPPEGDNQGAAGIDPGSAATSVSGKFRRLRRDYMRRVLTETLGNNNKSDETGATATDDKATTAAPDKEATAGRKRRQESESNAGSKTAKKQKLGAEKSASGSGSGVGKGQKSGKADLGSSGQKDTSLGSRDGGDKTAIEKVPTCRQDVPLDSTNIANETWYSKVLYAKATELVFFGPQSPFSMAFPVSVQMKIGPRRERVEFRTAEHAMQWFKGTMHPTKRNAKVRQKILAARSAKEAKALGMTIDLAHEGQDWKNAMLPTSLSINAAKFLQHPELLMLLMSTGTRALVYVSAEDKQWGIGDANKRTNKLLHNIQTTMLSILPSDKVNTEGWDRNVLGQHLMIVRETVRGCTDSISMMLQSKDLKREREERQAKEREAREAKAREEREAKLQAKLRMEREALNRLKKKSTEDAEGAGEGSRGDDDDNDGGKDDEEEDEEEEEDDDDDEELLNSMATFG